MFYTLEDDSTGIDRIGMLGFLGFRVEGFGVLGYGV